MYCTAAIGPIGEPERQLYGSPEEARSALMGELKRLRAASLDSADEINGALDELEVAGTDFFTIFYLDGAEWAAWYHEI